MGTWFLQWQTFSFNVFFLLCIYWATIHPGQKSLHIPSPVVISPRAGWAWLQSLFEWWFKTSTLIVARHKPDGQVEADVDRDSTQWITNIWGAKFWTSNPARTPTNSPVTVSPALQFLQHLPLVKAKQQLSPANLCANLSWIKKNLKTLQIQLAVPVKTSADVKANVCLTPGTSERMVGSVPLHICLTLVQTYTQFKFSWAIMRGGGPGNSCQHQASPCLSLSFHGPALSSLFKTITVTFLREKGISVRFRRKT